MFTEHKITFRIFFPLIFIFVLHYGSVAYSKEITLMELEAVSDFIMSPGCDYMYTLTNCPSAEAEQMKEIVKDRLSNGESRDEILAYFEKVYGPKILAQPAKKGFYFIAWWFPYFLLFDVFVLIGIVLFIWRKKYRTDSVKSNDSIGSNDDTDDEDLDNVLEKEGKEFRGLSNKP
jgi:cytochrome c-type biogenesis protein CcmH